MLFESLAFAQEGGAQQQVNPLMSFMPLILIFVIFYFLLIRPQQKKAKEHKAMLEALRTGDYVLTNGGIYGRISEVDGDIFTLELNDNLSVKAHRGYISSKTDSPNRIAKKSRSS